MANIQLSGNLWDPVDETPDVGAVMRFTHKSTTGNTIKNAVSEVVFPAPDAAYDITLEYGLVQVEYKTDAFSQYKNLGIVTVNQDQLATDLPGLLNAVVPPTDEQLLEFQAILADCVTAQNAAEQSAIDAAASAATISDKGIVARSLNVKDSQVIYHDDTSTVLDDILYIYDQSANQATWIKPPEVAVGETIISVSENLLLVQGGATYEMSPATVATQVWAQSSEVDASKNKVTAIGAAVARSLEQVFSDVINVKDHRATGDGVTDDDVAVNNAFIYAAELGGHQVIKIPAGTYIVSAIQILSNVTIVGDGIGATTLKRAIGDTNSSPILYATDSIVKERISIVGMTIQNTWGFDGGDFSEGTNNTLSIKSCESLAISKVRVTNSGAASIYSYLCDNVIVSECEISKSKRDGIRIVNYHECKIINNSCEEVLDDAIAAPNYPETNTNNECICIISGNTLVDTQGIQALGAKTVTIKGNIITRPMLRGILVGVGTADEEGSTPQFAVTVTGNTITDVLNGNLFDWAGGADGILIKSDLVKAGDIVETSDGTDVYSPLPYLYAVDYRNGVNPGWYNVQVNNNKVIRTLEATANYSDYGFGERFTVTGYADPEVTDDDLCEYGIYWKGAARDSIISGNVLSGCMTPIYIFQGGDSPVDSTRNLELLGNIFVNYTKDGLLLNGEGIVKTNYNVFDADPYYKHEHRLDDGSWDVGETQPSGVARQNDLNIIGSNNTFKNLNKCVPAGTFSVTDSILYIDPLDNASGLVTNKGIGIISDDLMFNAKEVFVYDLDPTSSTFGQLKTTCRHESVNSPPTSGVYFSKFVCKNYGNTSGYGWKRATTGNTHVLGVDWIAI